MLYLCNSILKNTFELKKSTIFDCSVIEFSKISTGRAGNITPIAGLEDIPFEIKRIFYLYDVPGGESRGAHAHKECHQLLIAASGSFDILLDDGKNKKTVSLNRANYGLHVLPGIWASELNFSSGAICLVLASHCYDENDYIREYSEYLDYVR